MAAVKAGLISTSQPWRLLECWTRFPKSEAVVKIDGAICNFIVAWFVVIISHIASKNDQTSSQRTLTNRAELNDNTSAETRANRPTHQTPPFSSKYFNLWWLIKLSIWLIQAIFSQTTDYTELIFWSIGSLQPRHRPAPSARVDRWIEENFHHFAVPQCF